MIKGAVGSRVNRQVIWFDDIISRIKAARELGLRWSVEAGDNDSTVAFSLYFEDAGAGDRYTVLLCGVDALPVVMQSIARLSLYSFVEVQSQASEKRVYVFFDLEGMRAYLRGEYGDAADAVRSLVGERFPDIDINQPLVDVVRAVIENQESGV